MGLYISLLLAGVLGVMFALPVALVSNDMSVMLFLLAGILTALSGVVGYFWNLD